VPELPGRARMPWPLDRPVDRRRPEGPGRRSRPEGLTRVRGAPFSPRPATAFGVGRVRSRVALARLALLCVERVGPLAGVAPSRRRPPSWWHGAPSEGSTSATSLSDCDAFRQCQIAPRAPWEGSLFEWARKFRVWASWARPEGSPVSPADRWRTLAAAGSDGGASGRVPERRARRAGHRRAGHGRAGHGARRRRTGRLRPSPGGPARGVCGLSVPVPMRVPLWHLERAGSGLEGRRRRESRPRPGVMSESACGVPGEPAARSVPPPMDPSDARAARWVRRRGGRG